MQKIIVILLASIPLVNSAHGQLAKGTWMIGGNAALATANIHSPSGSGNTTTISITPDIGYFVMDRFILGINPSYGLNASKTDDIHQTTLQSYAFGPFVRYYLLPVDHVVNLFTGGSYLYSILEPSNSIGNTYSFFAGTTAFFNYSVAIEMSAGFSSLITKNFITNSLVINAGFQIYLRKQ